MRSARLIPVVASAVFVPLLTACPDNTGPDCDPAASRALTIGVQVSEALDTGHCISGGDPGDLFSLNVTQTSVVLFTATSSSFQPEITIAKPSATPSPEDEVLFVAGSPAKAVAVLSPGQYVVDIQSSSNAVGSYTLDSETVGLNACYHANATPVFVVTGQTLSSEIANTDCPAPGGAFFETYTVRLRAGRSYTFTATTAINQFNLLLGTGSGALAGSGVITTNGTATINYAPTTSGYYQINFGPIGNRLGAYTLSIMP